MRTARNNKIEVHDHDSSLLIVWVAYQAVLIPSATPTQQQQTNELERELRGLSSDLTDLTDFPRENSNNFLRVDSTNLYSDFGLFGFNETAQNETKNGQLEI